MQLADFSVSFYSLSSQSQCKTRPHGATSLFLFTITISSLVLRAQTSFRVTDTHHTVANQAADVVVAVAVDAAT